jgi:hypothetical protein
MKKININARIRRNKLDLLAGESYRDENSEIVKYLNRVNKKALLGIQRTDGIYTIIGEEYTYYSTDLGVEDSIKHVHFLAILSTNAMRIGKAGNFEFIKVNERDSIWLKNAETMNALWNTILLLASVVPSSP